MTVEIIGVHMRLTHCHVRETSLKLYKLYDMVHCPVQSEDGCVVVIKEWTWSALQYSGRMRHLNDVQLVSNLIKCPISVVLK